MWGAHDGINALMKREEGMGSFSLCACTKERPFEGPQTRKRALKLGREPSPWIWPCWPHDLELWSSRSVRKIKNIYYLSHSAYGIRHGSRSKLRLCSWWHSTKTATPIYFFHGTCSSYSVTDVPSNEVWSLCPFLSGLVRGLWPSQSTE